MAEKLTLARPYAQAAFDLARQHNDLKAWSDMLQLATAVVTDPAAEAVIGNPRVEDSKLADLVINICGDAMTQHGQNFIRLLVENDRLTLLPEILVLFERYRAEAESTIHAEVISAFDVSAEQEKKIAAALKKKLGREVSLTSRKDASLLGGAIIRAGDLVIDGSVTGQLDKLAGALSR
jgi:F-type H+-transporting ATPase subunit delta